MKRRLWCMVGWIGGMLIGSAQDVPAEERTGAPSLAAPHSEQVETRAESRREARIEREHRAGAGRSDGSLIRIDFADPNIPDVDQWEPARRPAGDRVAVRIRSQAALDTPPPDPGMYEVEVTETEIVPSPAELRRSRLWGGSVDYFGTQTFYPGYRGPWGELNEPTPQPVTKTVRRFNRIQYNADLAQWQRDHARAMRHRAESEPPARAPRPLRKRPAEPSDK